MKNRILIMTLLVLSSIISSCSSEDDFNYQSDFEISQNAWLNFKESSSDSYKYTVTNSSWVGFSWETTITVKNGVVIQRDFEYTSTERLPTDIQQSELQWSENNSEIGTHENGANPMTLDEIYNKAQTDWLSKRKNTKTYFETENNGMISTCGYVDNQCTDDCFIGIKIKSIETL